MTFDRFLVNLDLLNLLIVLAIHCITLFTVPIKFTCKINKNFRDLDQSAQTAFKTRWNLWARHFCSRSFNFLTLKCDDRGEKKNSNASREVNYGLKVISFANKCSGIREIDFSCNIRDLMWKMLFCIANREQGRLWSSWNLILEKMQI